MSEESDVAAIAESPDQIKPRRAGRPRGAKTFHVHFDPQSSYGLERAAAARGLSPEALLTTIGRLVVRDRLVDAIIDD